MLVLIDAYSKWMDVVLVSSLSSQTTIKTLGTIFAMHGLPEMLVSDNGATFTSNDFRNFLKRNGIHHVVPALYHPATNDLAEQAIQTFKDEVKKMTVVDLQAHLALDSRSVTD